MKNNHLYPSIVSIIRVALPLTATRLLNILASFIALMIVAELGRKQLAASTLAVSTTLTLLTITTTIFYAIGILIRYYQAQNKPLQTIGILVKNGFFLAFILACPTAFGLSHMDRVLQALGQNPEIVALTTDFFLFASLGLFPLSGLMILGQFYTGIGKPHVPLIIELISFPLTIFLSYVFISGHFGCRQWGLSGISLATLMVQTLMFFVFLLSVYLKNHHRRYHLFEKPFFPDWLICRSILTLGLPVGLQFGGELAAIAASGYLMGYFGVNALAASQVVNQYSLLVIMLSVGLTQSMSLLVSEAYGKTPIDTQLIKKTIAAALLLLLLYCLGTSLLFCTYSLELMTFYMGTAFFDDEFIALIRFFFMLSAIFLLVDGLRHVLTGVLRGLHDSTIAMHINLAALWLISLPLSSVTVFLFKGGPIALRMAFLSGFLVAVILLASRLGKKLTIKRFSATAPACQPTVPS